MEHQVTAYIELRVKFITTMGLQMATTPSQTLFYILNYIQTKFRSDWKNFGWAIEAGMEQSCNFLLYMIEMERQDTAYIE